MLFRKSSRPAQTPCPGFLVKGGEYVHSVSTSRVERGDLGGGMFFAYVCLRPVAASLLEPPARLKLWSGSLSAFSGGCG